MKKKAGFSLDTHHLFSVRELVWAIIGALISELIAFLIQGKKIGTWFWYSDFYVGHGSITAWHIFILLIVIAMCILLINNKLGRGEMIKRRKMYKKMKTLVESDEYIQSVQLYQYQKPHTIKGSKLNYYAEIERIGGYNKTSCKTNCIISDEFSIPIAFYKKHQKLLNDLRNMNEKLLTTPEDIAERRKLFFELAKLTKEIYEEVTDVDDAYFFKMKTGKEIKAEHYYIYRFIFTMSETGFHYLQVMHNMLSTNTFNDADPLNYEEYNLVCYVVTAIQQQDASNPKSEVKFILKNQSIEKEIQKRRTRYLSALIFDEMWCFPNTESLTKAERCYFAVPISFNSLSHIATPKKSFFMIVTYLEPADTVKYEKYKQCEAMSEKILTTIR